MSNGTPPASKDPFSTVLCNSDYSGQWNSLKKKKLYHCGPILTIRPSTRGLHDLRKSVFHDVLDLQRFRQTDRWTLQLYDWIGLGADSVKMEELRMTMRSITTELPVSILSMKSSRGHLFVVLSFLTCSMQWALTRDGRRVLFHCVARVVRYAVCWGNNVTDKVPTGLWWLLLGVQLVPEGGDIYMPLSSVVQLWSMQCVPGWPDATQLSWEQASWLKLIEHNFHCVKPCRIQCHIWKMTQAPRARV